MEQADEFEKQEREKLELANHPEPQALPQVAHLPPPLDKPSRSPQNVLLAVSIVARCILRVIEGTVVLPRLQQDSFKGLCKRADVTALLQPLPWAGDLTTDPELSKDLMAGLNTLLRPLMRLSECRRPAGTTPPWAEDSAMPLLLEAALYLVRDDFVQALVDGYNNAQKGLPGENFPSLPVWGNPSVHDKLVVLEKTFRQHFQVGEQGLPFETESN